MKNHRLIILFLFVSTSLIVCAGDSASKLVGQLDLDKDGKLNKLEFQTGLFHRLLFEGKPKFDSGKFLRAYQDNNPDTFEKVLLLEIKPDDFDDYVSPISWFLDFYKQEGLDISRPIPIKYFPDPFLAFRLGPEIVTEKPDQEKKFTRETEFLLRRNLDEFSSSVKKSKGALLSFGRDHEKGQDTWIARGSVGVRHSKKINPKYPEFKNEKTLFKESGLLLFSSFEKVDVSEGDEGEIDSLVFGFGYDRRWAFNDDNHLNQLKIKTEIEHSTDFDFDFHVLSGNVDFFLITPKLGLNGGGLPNQIDGIILKNSGNDVLTLPFFFSVILKGHIEAGDVFDAGDNPELIEESFARIGGEAGLIIWPDIPYRLLSLSASYLHYETVMSDMVSPYVFEAEAKWQFTPSVDAYFTVNYKKGITTDSLERVDLVTAGLAVAF